MLSKEEARQKIDELVAKYQSLTPSAIKGYNEAKTKQGFIEPLFQYLRWDFFNTDEVSPEEKASKGRVDYAFKLRGVSQFYLEAKPLKADLNEVKYIEQAVTYAYNKGVTWAVLTDFESLRLFNAQTGKAFLNLASQDYLTDFEKLWLLSKESLESGSLNKEAAKVGALPAPQPVEKRLFAQLRQWREELFSQLHLHNPHLTFDQIDEVIQRLINRLIFIRNAEDRGIEERVLLATINRWESSGHEGELIEALRGIFRQFDGYYDSDLFMLHPLDQVFIESDTLADILRGLYEIPGVYASYDFSVIDADVLGAVYEQYLGYVATIVKERAKEEQARLKLGVPGEVTISLEEKRKKRKEEGIYYTPKWVVDYIVGETVGRFIKEHSHDEIVKMKILDPACGSGSFLIRAYDELLRYHAGVKGKVLEELDQWDRLPILTGNIYGVDLDSQAVEIARLNLLIRSLARRETLPSLAENIRRGNSLISGTEEELKKYFGDKWRDKKPFNWKEEFKDIMAQGGFDVVIGNPPWVESKRMDMPDKSYYEDIFQSMKTQYDIFNGFLERGVGLLKKGGLLGFILPSRFLMNPDYDSFRQFLLKHTRLLGIRDVGEHVFEGVEMPALILTVAKEQDAGSRANNQVQVRIDIDGQPRGMWKGYLLPQSRFQAEPRMLFTVYQSPVMDTIVAKMESNAIRFSDIMNNARGVEIGKKASIVSSSPKGANYVPFLVGEDIDRYAILGHRYLKLGAPDVDYKEAALYRGDKILIRKTGTGIRAVLDERGFYVIQVIYIFKPKAQDINLRFLLGILNSKLMSFYYFAKFGEKMKKAFPHLRQEHVLSFPIRRIDFNNPTEKKLHDELVALVDKMLTLNKKLQEFSEYEAERKQEVEREIRQTDEKIDNLVFDLYGLTEEERSIVSESGS